MLLGALVDGYSEIISNARRRFVETSTGIWGKVLHGVVEESQVRYDDDRLVQKGGKLIMEDVSLGKMYVDDSGTRSNRTHLGYNYPLGHNIKIHATMKCT